MASLVSALQNASFFLHTSNASPLGLRQKTGFVFPGLQKLQGMCASCCILQMCHFLPHISTLGGCMDIYCLQNNHWPGVMIEPRGAAALECTLSALACSPRWYGPARCCGDTNSGWHFKMTGFLSAQRNAHAGVWAQLLFWQSGRGPGRNDDRRTASRWYQHLRVCLRMPQDIGHACVPAVYSLSGRDNRPNGTGRD